MKEELLLLSSNRKPKTIISHSKKLIHPQQKIVKKSLSSVYTPITENDVVLDLLEKESSQISSIDDDQSTVSEVSAGVSSVSDAFVSYDDALGESRESPIVSLDHFNSPLSVKSGSLEMTPLSSKTAVEMTPVSSKITAEADEAATEEPTSFETESLVKLRESMFQDLHSAEITPVYKKLLDELAKIEKEEREGTIADLLSRKETILLLSFVLGILAVLTRFFVVTDVQSSSYGPPPT